MEVKQMSEETQSMTKQSITALDPGAENKTYKGGCELLFKWYRDIFNQNNS